MKLYIPELGDKLRLTKAWTFPLYPDTRNKDLGQLKGLHYNYRGVWTKEENDININAIKYSYVRYADFTIDGKHDNEAYKDATKAAQALYQCELDKYAIKDVNIEIPENTILKVDRIYIRKGKYGFNSISFYTDAFKNPKTGRTKLRRFWAKLDDCNNIEFEKVE